MNPLLLAIPLLAAPPAKPAPNAPKPSPFAARVLVVCNQNSRDSVEIASYYMRKRQVPTAHILRIQTGTDDTLPTERFESEIASPIKRKIAELKKPIDFIVLTKGLPIRVKDGWGYSVDSLVAGLPLGWEPSPPGPTAPTSETIERMISPYFNSGERFNSAKFKMYLVGRLDGYTVADAKALVDRSIAATPAKGLFFFDQSYRGGEASDDLDRQLLDAGNLVVRRGRRAITEQSKDFVDPKEPLMGYISWGSNDPKFDPTTYRALRFLPGSIAETFVSTSARSFRPETSGQSQIGDLIRQGVTGVKGYVSEPWTIALARPAILVERYTRGWTLAESFYAASPVIKWKDIVVGDPIAAPYAK